MTMPNSIFFKTIVPVLFVGLMQQNANAQSKIHGMIQNQDNQPVSNANVLLLKAKDSSLVKGMITTQTGAYYLNVLL